MFSSVKSSRTLLATLPLKCGRNHSNCSVIELYRTQSNLIEPVSIKHGLQTADHGLWTVYKTRTRYKMQTRNYGLSIKHGLRTVYIYIYKKLLSSPIVAVEVGEATTENVRHRQGE